MTVTTDKIADTVAARADAARHIAQAKAAQARARADQMQAKMSAKMASKAAMNKAAMNKAAMKAGAAKGATKLAAKSSAARSAAKVAVLKHRDLAARIDGGVFRLIVRAREEVDDLVIEVDARFLREEHDRAAGRRHRMVVELHGGPPER